MQIVNLGDTTADGEFAETVSATNTLTVPTMIGDATMSGDALTIIVDNSCCIMDGSKGRYFYIFKEEIIMISATLVKNIIGVVLSSAGLSFLLRAARDEGKNDVRENKTALYLGNDDSGKPTISFLSAGKDSTAHFPGEEDHCCCRTKEEYDNLKNELRGGENWREDVWRLNNNGDEVTDENKTE